MIVPDTCPASEFHVTWSPVLNLCFIASFLLFWHCFLKVSKR
jgi:hypothetical protein